MHEFREKYTRRLEILVGDEVSTRKEALKLPKALNPRQPWWIVASLATNCMPLALTYFYSTRTMAVIFRRNVLAMTNRHFLNRISRREDTPEIIAKRAASKEVYLAKKKAIRRAKERTAVKEFARNTAGAYQFL